MRMIHLKEEGLEIVGHVGDDEEEHGGNIDGEDGAKQSSGKYLSYFVAIAKMSEDKYSCGSAALQSAPSEHHLKKSLETKLYSSATTKKL